MLRINTMLRNFFLGALMSLAFLTACGGGGKIYVGKTASNTSTASVTANASSLSNSIRSSMASMAASSTPVLGMSHNPGQDCLSCHRAGGTGAVKAIFTLAGTVYKTGGAAQTQGTVKLFIHPTNTLSISLKTDSLGNFYTTTPVTGLFVAGGPFVSGVDVAIDGPAASDTKMDGLVTNGSCNACHGVSTARITAN